MMNPGVDGYTKTPNQRKISPKKAKRRLLIKHLYQKDTKT